MAKTVFAIITYHFLNGEKLQQPTKQVIDLRIAKPVDNLKFQDRIVKSDEKVEDEFFLIQQNETVFGIRNFTHADFAALNAETEEV